MASAGDGEINPLIGDGIVASPPAHLRVKWRCSRRAVYDGSDVEEMSRRMYPAREVVEGRIRLD